MTQQITFTHEALEASTIAEGLQTAAMASEAKGYFSTAATFYRLSEGYLNPVNRRLAQMMAENAARCAARAT